jgi:hypothetical protein
MLVIVVFWCCVVVLQARRPPFAPWQTCCLRCLWWQRTHLTQVRKQANLWVLRKGRSCQAAPASFFGGGAHVVTFRVALPTRIKSQRRLLITRGEACWQPRLPSNRIHKHPFRASAASTPSASDTTLKRHGWATGVWTSFTLPKAQHDMPHAFFPSNHRPKGAGLVDSPSRGHTTCNIGQH